MTRKLTTLLAAAVLGATAASTATATASVSPNPLRYSEPNGWRYAEPTGIRYSSVRPGGLYRGGSLQPNGIRWRVRPNFRVVRF
jgi:hypothetical protein